MSDIHILEKLIEISANEFTQNMTNAGYRLIFLDY